MKKTPFMNKGRNFYKIFFISISITVIFIIITATISSTLGTRFITKKMIEHSHENISKKSFILEQRVENIEDSINLILEDEDVFKLIMTDQEYYERPIAVLRIIKKLKNICDNSRFIYGIRLYDIERNICITDKTKESIDGDIISDDGFRICRFEELEKLIYTRNICPVNKKNHVVINCVIDINELLENIDDELEENTYIITKYNDIFNLAGSLNLPESIKKSIFSTDYFGKCEVDGIKYMIYERGFEDSGIGIITLQDYSKLFTQSNQLRKTIIILSLITIIGAGIIIYIVSLYIYSPLKKLSKKVSHYDKKILHDEYKLIEEAIDDLENEKIKLIEPLLRDSAIRLIVEPFDEECFKYVKKNLLADMKYPEYIIVIIEFERSDENNIINIFRKFLSDTKYIEGFIVKRSLKRYIGLINTSIKHAQLMDKLEKLKKELLINEINGFTICLSRRFINPVNINILYLETIEYMRNKFFKAENEIIYPEDMSIESGSFKNVKEMENSLWKLIIEKNIAGIDDTLYEMRLMAVKSEYDIAYIRFIYFEICRTIISNTLEIKIEYVEKYDEEKLFCRIFKAESIFNLEEIIREKISDCIEILREDDIIYSDNVRRAMDFIKDNYMNDISLENVAESVFLSSGYLSIIFKEESGFTVLEYITAIRMKKAKELLMYESSMKVKDIAETLGYNNVQSFIRFFKKHYNETPAAFRKNSGK